MNAVENCSYVGRRQFLAARLAAEKVIIEVKSLARGTVVNVASAFGAITESGGTRNNLPEDDEAANIRRKSLYRVSIYRVIVLDRVLTTAARRRGGVFSRYRKLLR